MAKGYRRSLPDRFGPSISLKTIANDLADNLRKVGTDVSEDTIDEKCSPTYGWGNSGLRFSKVIEMRTRTPTTTIASTTLDSAPAVRLSQCSGCLDMSERVRRIGRPLSGDAHIYICIYMYMYIYIYVCVCVCPPPSLGARRGGCSGPQEFSVLCPLNILLGADPPNAKSFGRSHALLGCLA